MTDTAKRFQPARIDFSAFKPNHFGWRLDGKVATITLNRPERKNPLTLESYAELRDTFRERAEISARGATCTRSLARSSR